MNQTNPLLSICIPVKDFDVHPLVEALLKEIREENLSVEIIVVEDGSSTQGKALNESLSSEPELRLFSFDTNKGRSAARNFMAQQANGQYLLFIDADSLPVSPLFISLYIDQLRSDVILSGGRHYSDLYRTPERLLHWKYGIHREISSALKTNRVGFQSNNFLIKKDVFDAIQFDESIVLYGHEDTLFGIMAKAHGIEVLGIDNPVIHTSLETNTIFLLKTEESIVTLLQIIQQKDLYPAGIDKEFRLWFVYKKLSTYKLTWILQVLAFWHRPIKKIILTFSGPLVLYDLYKLLLFHKGSIAIQSANK
ncbi:MAG: putative glycosyltransferase [Chitinophagaceae bacterium]|nr:putative glycosyltransferase [Chitinophagaceae bacterium]